MKEIRNNYHDVIEMWQQKAVQWDFAERYEALGLAGYQKEGRLPIQFYDRLYQIDRLNGCIQDAREPDRKVNFETAMAIYSLFYHSRKQPQNTGIWVPFRDVKRAAPFTEAFKRTTLIPFARAFNGHLEQLRQAGKELGFEAITQADAGFQAAAFSCMPLRFLFWDGDDEFEAQANILFDAQITDYIHEETVVLVAGEGTRRLINAAGRS